MGRVFELFDSRVSSFHFKEEKAELRFSFAYIYLEQNADVVWSQEVTVLMDNAQFEVPLPILPNTVVEGYLMLGNKHYDTIPLPLPEKLYGRIFLKFADESVLSLQGERLEIKLLGKKIFLSEQS